MCNSTLHLHCGKLLQLGESASDSSKKWIFMFHGSVCQTGWYAVWSFSSSLPPLQSICHKHRTLQWNTIRSALLNPYQASSLCDPSASLSVPLCLHSLSTSSTQNINLQTRNCFNDVSSCAFSQCPYYFLSFQMFTMPLLFLKAMSTKAPGLPLCFHSFNEDTFAYRCADQFLDSFLRADVRELSVEELMRNISLFPSSTKASKPKL